MKWPRALPILVCAALIPTGCDGDDHGGEVDLANGESIHESTCMVAGCHADNGVMLDEHVPEHSDDQLFEVIDLGTELMPAQAQLSDQDIADVIAYVRMLYG